MSDEFSAIEGEEIVKLARKAVEQYLFDSTVIKPDSSRFSQIRGVFVTLNYVSSKNEEHLRGCIGFPYPEKKLAKSMVEAAIAAATQDPRFPPVRRDDLSRITFEVSILTPPTEIKAKNPYDCQKEIKIGRDGLIIKSDDGSGLLLPQVPVELKWNVEEYLENICYKAGVPPDTWLLPNTKLYRFQAIVFKEEKPNGKVLRLNLGSE